MAKMIKCPTCGTQIELPPNAAGQVVKCPGCGKGLKLVAKSKAAAGAGPQQQHAGEQQNAGGRAGGAGGSPGGSVAGGSVAAMSFAGEAPPPHERPAPSLDDLPSLESNCAVCGRATDPNDLIEDNGRLVCGDCIKGARSAIARPEGGAELIDFAPTYAPVRRGKLINITPSFIIGAVAALVFVVASLVLHLEVVSKPVGTAIAVPQRSGAVAAVTAGTTPPGITVTHAGSDASPPPPPPPTEGAAATPGDHAAAADASAAVAPQPNDSTSPPAPAPADPPPGGVTEGSTAPDSATPGENQVAIAPPVHSIFTDPPDEAPAPPPAPTEGAAAPAVVEDPAAAPSPAITSADPLVRGLERLRAGDYAKAIGDLNQARLRYVVSKTGPPGQPLTPQQQQVLEALAAAYIGQGRYELASGSLELAFERNVRTRSLMLNTAIYMINTQRPPAALSEMADLLQNYLAAHPGDEYAADIFGTLVDKIARTGRTPKEKVDAYWTFLDRYVDQVAQQRGESGKLKWGIDWLAAEDVKAFRQSRGVQDPVAAVRTAAQSVESAWTRVRDAEKRLKDAAAARELGQAADVEGAQNQLDAANAALTEAQQALREANAAVNRKPPRWLAKFEPILPSPTT